MQRWRLRTPEGDYRPAIRSLCAWPARAVTRGAFRLATVRETVSARQWLKAAWLSRSRMSGSGPQTSGGCGLDAAEHDLGPGETGQVEVGGADEGALRRVGGRGLGMGGGRGKEARRQPEGRGVRMGLFPLVGGW